MRATLTVLTAMAFTLGAGASDALAASSTVVGFDEGADGGFIGNAVFRPNGGVPGGSAHFLVTAFGMELRTGGIGEPSNPDFLGDYSSSSQVTFSFDVKVDSITDFIGNEIPRAIGIALRDRDIMGPNGPSGVFFELDTLSVFTHADWTRLSVTILDTTQTDLPAGWIGFGDDDPNTFEPILPAGATFASVLAGVDEFQVTTLVPGFFFNNANFNVRVDNVSVALATLTGAVGGGTVLFAQCRNTNTGQQSAAVIGEDNAWACAGDLVVSPGDLVVLIQGVSAD